MESSWHMKWRGGGGGGGVHFLLFWSSSMSRYDATATSYNPRAFREVLRRRVSFAGMHAIGKLRPVTAATRSCPRHSAAGRARAGGPASVGPGTAESEQSPSRCVKYVDCPLKRTTPVAKNALAGRNLIPGDITAVAVAGQVVSAAAMLMTSGALTPAVQYRRLTDVCPSPPTPRHRVSPLPSQLLHKPPLCSLILRWN